MNNANINPTAPAPIQSAEQVERDLAATQRELDALKANLPFMPALERAIAEATTAATLDPKLRPELQQAMRSMREAEEVLATKASLERRIGELRLAYDAAKQRSRMERIARCDARTAQLRSDYLAAGRQVVRAYRALLTQHRIAQLTPGADVGMPAGFHFAPAVPISWQGHASDIMRDGGTLPCEADDQVDQEQAA